MPGYGFPLTRIVSYKNIIVDSVFIQENIGQWKSLFSHIFVVVMIKRLKLYAITTVF